MACFCTFVLALCKYLYIPGICLPIAQPTVVLVPYGAVHVRGDEFWMNMDGAGRLYDCLGHPVGTDFPRLTCGVHADGTPTVYHIAVTSGIGVFTLAQTLTSVCSGWNPNCPAVIFIHIAIPKE